MENPELAAELDRLRIMVNAVNKLLRDEDADAALLLTDIAGRLLVLADVAEKAADIDEDATQAKADEAAEQAERDI